jgi:hypothetical protein
MNLPDYLLTVLALVGALGLLQTLQRLYHLTLSKLFHLPVPLSPEQQRILLLQDRAQELARTLARSQEECDALAKATIKKL